MPGKGSQKRSNALAIRCYKLRQEGCTLSQIADLAGLERDKVAARIALGERLLSLETDDER